MNMSEAIDDAVQVNACRESYECLGERSICRVAAL